MLAKQKVEAIQQYLSSKKASSDLFGKEDHFEDLAKWINELEVLIAEEDKRLTSYFNLFTQYKQKADRLEKKERETAERARKNYSALNMVESLGIVPRFLFFFAPSAVVATVKKTFGIEEKK